MIDPNSSERSDKRAPISRRSRKAAATRHRVLSEARRELAAHGYARTTLEQVAEAVDVAVQTVYAIHGSKSGLLFALLETMRDDAAYREHIAALNHETDPHCQLDLLVDFAATIFERGHDVVEILRGAGSANPDAVEVWRAGEGRRREKDRRVVRRWRRRGALACPPQQAEAIPWSLTGPDVFRLLVVETGWPIHTYRSWLRETLAAQLLAPPGQTAAVTHAHGT